MDCRKCGAPLPAKSRVCRFCSTLADVDLRQRRKRRLGAGERPCPRCETPLEILHIDVAGGLEIDRCEACHGIFFDPGELEDVLSEAEAGTHDVDHQRLDVLAEEETETRDFEQVSYVPCPDCGRLMNRKSWGSRSGVVVDRCRDHGVWVDGGELRRLVEWSRAGGRLHHLKREEEREAAEKRLKKFGDPGNEGPVGGPPILTRGPGSADPWSSWDAPRGGLLDVLAGLVRLLT